MKPPKKSSSPSAPLPEDDELMARAGALGQRVRSETAPNPWVGAVVVSDGEIVGEGSTEPPGRRHAEIVALDLARERASGATVYVTLEPCVHDGRTGPCVEALIAAGVNRVVVAVEDPDERMRGRGIDALRNAGISVSVGVGAESISESLAPYLHHRLTGRAWCLLKVAASLDGRVAAADGNSKWITGVEARADSHRLRYQSQAVVVGSGTAIADSPLLTVRLPEEVGNQPLRVLLDGRGRVLATGPLFDTELASTLVITTDNAPNRIIDDWRAAGAKVETVNPSTTGQGVDLRQVLELLGAHGVIQALFEGGPKVSGALIADDLVDYLVAYTAGIVLGTDATPSFAAQGVPSLDEAPKFALRSCVAVGTDARLDFVPVKRS